MKAAAAAADDSSWRVLRTLVLPVTAMLPSAVQQCCRGTVSWTRGGSGGLRAVLLLTMILPGAAEGVAYLPTRYQVTLTSLAIPVLLSLTRKLRLPHVCPYVRACVCVCVFVFSDLGLDLPRRVLPERHVVH